MKNTQSDKLERLENRICRENGNLFSRLTPIYAAQRSQAERLLKSVGGLSTIEWRVLWDLFEVGPLSVRELAKIQRADHSKFSRALPAMRAKGYVLIERDKNDGRQTMVSMAEAGLAAYQLAAPVMKRRRAALHKEFSAQELETYVGFIDRFEKFLHKSADDVLNEDQTT
ncbi:MAG: DNA-binding MarR family transcriptional regulator [Paracoccaceae bacterium]|jgi:DNA-binding MarR family transcriptional regulator